MSVSDDNTTTSVICRNIPDILCESIPIWCVLKYVQDFKDQKKKKKFLVKIQSGYPATAAVAIGGGGEGGPGWAAGGPSAFCNEWNKIR